MQDYNLPSKVAKLSPVSTPPQPDSQQQTPPTQIAA